MVNNISAASAAGSAMANHTLFDTTLPPLPEYTLTPQGDMFPYFSDVALSLGLPVVVYWVLSMFFHILDVYDLFPQHRLHTPEEITSRNHVSRYEVARDVVIQQILQVGMGALLALTEPQEMSGKEDYDIAVWATRIRLAQRVIPTFLGLVGLNATALSKSMSASHPMIAGAIAGGYYPFLTTSTLEPAFATWELYVAGFVYHFLIPAMQFFGAMFILDTWQYFLHRLMHTNRWMYTTFHSRHHRLYVPYAYGALYNHPFEGFLLDTIGASLAFKVMGMTMRQGTLFFTFSSMKTVDDHCGYAFPWDPLQLVSNNNAAYHDIHHQTWGIKTNFSQPFFTFWDSILNTTYSGSRSNLPSGLRKTADKTTKAAKAE